MSELGYLQTTSGIDKEVQPKKWPYSAMDKNKTSFT